MRRSARFTSVSWSRWDQYEGCPAFAKYKHLDKLPEPADPDGPLARGQAIHDLGQDYIEAGGDPTVPAEFEAFAEPLRDARRLGGRAEVDLAFTRSWERCASTDWDRAFLRVKIDLAVVRPMIEAGKKSRTKPPDELLVVDYKTGKYRRGDVKYGLQLELYDVAALSLGKYGGVTSELWFVDHATIEEHGRRFPTDAKSLQREWERRFEPMLSDTVFAPRPGPKCNWCPYAKREGGPCDFGE